MINTIRKLCGYKFPRLGKYINRFFFKICPTQVQCELFPQIYVKLNLKDLTQQATFWQGDRFEYPTACVLRDWGDITSFFDIGANYGFYCYFMLSNHPDLQAYAFEPNPETHTILAKIKNDNNLDRLCDFQLGLGSQVGEFDLHPGLNDSGHSTFLPHPELFHKSLGKIKITTFDQWLIDEKLKIPKRPEWIAKIDVEGMEYDVLLGMQAALKSKVFKLLVIEILDHTLALAGRRPEDIIFILDSFGYKPISKSRLLRKYGRINTANVFFELH
jgi:FkbM family methyltransferase